MVFYDHTASKERIRFEDQSVMTVLKDISRGAITSKYSENFFERTLRVSVHLQLSIYRKLTIPSAVCSKEDAKL